MAFQVIGQARLNRSKRHVWYKKVLQGEAQSVMGWKCVLCGAVTEQTPPTDVWEEEDWTPERYEPLTDEERKMCPMPYGGYLK